MKNLFKKLLVLFEISLILWIFFYAAYLVYIEDWLKLIKHSIYCFIGFGIAFFEIPEVIMWKLKKVFKYNDFD